MALALVLAGTVLLMAQCAFGKYSIETAGIKVISPPDSKRVMTMAMADFGLPKYGGTLRGQLVYISSEDGYGTKYKCFPEDCQYGCSLFNTSVPPFALNRQLGNSYIMLLDRGPRNIAGHNPCFFIDKVYFSQLAGVDAVLVVNDEPGDLSTAIAPDDEMSSRELASLRVSAGMVSQDDGNFLKSLLKEGQPVTIMLNWTSVVARTKVVQWELWTNSNDQCGFHCLEQLAFIKNMTNKAQALENAGVAHFTPHYMLWTPTDPNGNATQLASECIMNGTYCVPEPDDDPTKGYSGRDVLRMNMIQLCFHRVAQAAGKGNLWWNYTSTFAANCSMASQQYTEACATTVFNSLDGPNLVAGGGGLAAWQACYSYNETDALAKAAAGIVNATKVAMLEEELMAQNGNETVPAVSILPTVRINGAQFRGELTVPNVVRAICAAFPQGQEPAMCNEQWVSEDECQPGGVGYQACMSGEGMGAGNKTKCVNTFASYTCECRDGMVKSVNPDTGDERCEDINECLATNVPITDPLCSCQRCACINKIGSYKCTGPLEDKCTAATNFMGCWSGIYEGTTYHGCKDTLWEYQRLAPRGLVNDSSTWWRCECPKCFKSTADGKGCEPICELHLCSMDTGVCSAPGTAPAPQPAHPSSSGGGSSSGIGVGALVGIVLATAVLTGVLVMAANKFIMQKRMGDEIRDIMSQYMPLGEARGRGGPGSGPGAGAANGNAPASGRRGERRGLLPSRGPPGGFEPVEEEDDEEASGGVGAYGWPAAPGATASRSAAAAPAAAAAAQPALALSSGSGGAATNRWGPPAGGVGGSAFAAAAGAPQRGSEAKTSGASSAFPRPTIRAAAVPAAHDDSGYTPPTLDADADPLMGRTVSSGSAGGGGTAGTAPAPERRDSDSPLS